MRFTRPLAVVTVAAALLAGGCSSDDQAAPKKPTTTVAPGPTVPKAGTGLVDVLATNPDFSTLSDLISKSGLTVTLSGTGPFTLLAPTNEAFAKMDPAALAALTADPNVALANVLKLHIVSGKVMAADLTNLVGYPVPTLNGGSVAVAAAGTTVTIGGATVISGSETPAANGVIHAVDAVITSPS